MICIPLLTQPVIGRMGRYIQHSILIENFINQLNQTILINPNLGKKWIKLKKIYFQVSSSDQDGEVLMKEKSSFEEGMQIHRSLAYKKKIKRLAKLNERTNKKEFKSAKNMISTRFVLTKVEHDLTVEDIKSYLLRNIEEIDDVYVRKNPMSHNKYATFVLIVYSENEVNRKILEDNDWPGQVKCFFSPNER